MANLEDVFVTEGRPKVTYVDPPNYAQLLSDIRSSSKPVVVEGQSGTGKTTVVTTILERVGFENHEYLTCREPAHVERISEVIKSGATGVIVVDDYHRLDTAVQTSLADMAKDKADRGDGSPHPKLVLIGINQIGESLIQLAHDVAKRLGIHRVFPASRAEFDTMVSAGEHALNIRITNPDVIWTDCGGDYWLVQRLLKLCCSQNNITETVVGDMKLITVQIESLRELLTTELRSAYQQVVKEFCRGRRFRPGNDPYFKLLRAVSEGDTPIVDIKQLANQIPGLRQSLNNIKDRRLNVLLDEKPDLKKYFHFNSSNAIFTIEDQALFYYIKNLNWDELRNECGFRPEEEEKEFDVAISFAGENRALATMIAERLRYLDFNVFYDRFYEANFLGDACSSQFERIFGEQSHFVVCLLDTNYRDKIWPTFERESFMGRVGEKKVIPIYLDDTIFAGIPKDIVGVYFKECEMNNLIEKEVDEKIISPLIEKLDRSV